MIMAPFGFPAYRGVISAMIEALRAYVLSNHYNLRLITPQILSVRARPEILHGRSPKTMRMAAELKAMTDHRLFIPNQSNFGRLDFSVSGEDASALALRFRLSLSAAFARFLRGSAFLLYPSRLEK